MCISWKENYTETASGGWEERGEIESNQRMMELYLYPSSESKFNEIDFKSKQTNAITTNRVCIKQMRTGVWKSAAQKRQPA